jgi:leucyl aminopeptidase
LVLFFKKELLLLPGLLFVIPKVRLKRACSGDWPLAIPVCEGAVPAHYQAAAQIGEFTGAARTVCDIAGGKRRILLVGTGRKPDRLAMEEAGALAASRALNTKRLTFDLRHLKRRNAAALLTGAALRAWRFDRLRTKPAEDAPVLNRIFGRTDDERLKKTWARQHAIVHAVAFARDLVTEPANILTPDGFAARLITLTEAGVRMQILRGPALEDAQLTGLIAVGRAAANPPALAILRWRGKIDAPPVAFVGKGITFDTGGISIKPADLMWEMRADMAGAAACAGAMLALAATRSPAPAIAVLALAENAVGANAYRPSDILRHANGTTIEAVDTDAEGRLVLIDALHYAAAQNPAAIIDLATLTGSVVTALGHHLAGLFSNDPPLAAAASGAGAKVGEPVWHLPIDESHRRAIDSDIADLRHCVPARGHPDACYAAAFLREFVGDTPWVHLDIAGVESRAEATDTNPAGATGWGVRLLTRLVRDRFEDPHRA